MKALEEKDQTLYKKGIDTEGKSINLENVDTLFSLEIM